MSKRINFSAHVMNVFNEMETNYEEIKNLMYDLAMGNEIYDVASERVISKNEAEDKLRSVC